MPEIRKKPINEPGSWTSDELASDSSWIYHFSKADLKELDQALHGVQGLGAGNFGREDFILPTLELLFKEIIQQIEFGRGCALIKGLNVTAYDPKTLETLYWGIAAHFGMLVHQNPNGDLIGHVTDSGRDYKLNNVRGYSTKAELKPHCDPTDVVALLCKHPSKSGGESCIASSLAIYNEILETHPEYLEILAQGFHFDLRGEGVTTDPNETSFNRVPTFSYFNGRMSCRYNSRTMIEGMEKAGKPLNEKELRAVHYVAELALSSKFRYDMVFEQGDIQILSNYGILHSRKGFVDFPEPERKRDLLRLWLNLRNGRQLAPEFADRLNTGPRGGICLKDDRRPH
jgi:hypothetical protein